MIAGVSGILAATGDDWIHLTVGGVTFQVLVPASEILTLGPVGAQVQLFTHLRIRDDQPVLYGFTSQAGLDLFLATQAVSGVGPRLGLALVSGLGAAGLQQAIALWAIPANSAAFPAWAAASPTASSWNWKARWTV